MPDSLVDRWLPRFDVRSHHHIDVAAEPDLVWRALYATDLGGHPITRALMAMRSLPSFLLAPRRTLRRLRRSTTNKVGLEMMLQGDFVLLEAVENDELVIGLTGRFWTLSGGLVETTRENFLAALDPGLARAAWSFRVLPIETGTRLSTETRVLCGSPRTRGSFLRYWRIVGPFSGLIRSAILRQTAATARREMEGN